MARGAVGGWFTAHARDDPRQLAQGLALGVRIASRRASFARALIEGDAGPQGIDAVTELLHHRVFGTELGAYIKSRCKFGWPSKLTPNMSKM